MTRGEWFRRTGMLLLVASVSLPLQVVAANMVFPIAWVFAFFHQATVLAYTHPLGPHPLRELIRRSARLSHDEPLAHHLLLLVMGVLALLVWGGVFALGLVVPHLFKMLTGVESEFTRNPLAAAFNTLYLSVTVGTAWMMISPYFRVVYVLRTFRVLSRRTGDDLLARLEAVRARAANAVAVVVLGLLVVTGGGVMAAPAPELPPVAEVSSAAEAAELATAIRATLEAREYQWRLPRAVTPGAAAEENSLWAAITHVVRTAKQAWRDVQRFISEARRAVRRLLGGDATNTPAAGGSAGVFSGDALRTILYLTGIVAAAGWLVWGIVCWRRRRRRSSAAVEGVAPSAAVDLAAETTLASALPEDEWLRLARAQQEAGDHRLAVRAVFLATLASLGDQRLIDIRRSKSNRDYLVEVRLRVAARRDVPEVFGRSVGVFERVWYGWHDVAPEWVTQLLENHQKLTTRVPTA